MSRSNYQLVVTTDSDILITRDEMGETTIKVKTINDPISVIHQLSSAISKMGEKE